MSEQHEKILQWGRETIAIETDALGDLEKSLGQPFIRAVEAISQFDGKTIVTGMGKSGLISRKIASTLASTGTPAFFLHPAESIHGDLGMLDSRDGVIAISFSGETNELNTILPIIKRKGLKIVSLTKSSTSTLGRLSDICLEIPIQKEACPHNLAPTASTTATLALGDAIAMALLNLRGFQPEDFRDLHPGGSLGRSLTRVEEIMLGAEDLPILEDHAPISEILISMEKKIEGHGRGVVGVLDKDGRLVGVVTDGDLRRMIGAGQPVGAQPLAKDLMSPNPKRIRKGELVESALEMMERHSVSALFVYDQDPDRPVGILYLHTLLKARVI